MRYLTLLLLPFFLFLTACGGGNQQNGQTAETGDAQKQMAQTDDVRTVHIFALNKMKFVVKEAGERIGTGETIDGSDGSSYLLLEDIKVAPGEKLRIKLTTVSKLPANAMSHNWILLALGADAEAFASAAMMARTSGYIPTDLADQIIAHTELAGGGKTVEVTFTVPKKTGQYDYLCSFPAHFMSGMKGKLIVE
ncbi:MAG TPA: plastocyanin/azurin family copper-binding protein [Balneolaceae bacterium]|nr:plastocyanin/azurin family copper-binding protein [Balneolaceae bacterium]